MKKIVKFLIVCLVVLAVSFGALWILGLGVMPSESYVKSQMYEFYHAGSVDTIFVGPSFVYRGINPEIVDSICGTNSFNLGTSSQKPIDSYFMIKEAVRVQPIKMIVLDVSQGFYAKESDFAAKSTYLILDRMKNSSVKREYIEKAFDFDEMPQAYLKACHYDFPNLSGFAYNFKGAFSKGEPVKVNMINEWYVDRGFVTSEQVYEGTEDSEKEIRNVDEESLKWLGEIISFCKEKDIRLIVVSSPKTKDYYESQINYDKNAEFITNYLKNSGYEYNDFCDIIENDNFVDREHLNGKGAEKFSEMIAGLIKKDA